MQQIKHQIKEEDAQIVFLLETDEEKCNLEAITIEGFKTVVGEEGSEGTSRLMAFVADEIEFKIRNDLSSADVSSLWIEIERQHHKNLLIAGVYREWGNVNNPIKNRSKEQQIQRIVKTEDQIKKAKKKNPKK